MPRPARTTGKRPPVTSTKAFLFSDLRDYTTYVEAHGDAAAARLLREYRTLVRREVARHKGAEIKTEGDSFYVVFESPSAALDCAVAILRKVRGLEDAPDGLRIGIGLHAGETVSYDKQFVGSAVNVASRLASKAEAGELLISDTLRGLVRTGRSYPMAERGRLNLKGVSEPIQAWSVQVEEGVLSSSVVLPPIPAPRSPPAAGQIVCPVVIGREAELAQAEAALDAAVAGRGQTIVVAGEAGGGKSAFVREVESRAHARGFRALLGATLESDRTLPYAPFIAAVRSGFRGIERDRLGRVLAQTAPDLAQLFPELGRAARPESASATEQHRLTVAFHGLFTAFAREAPILVVLEDLHWSDEASLDLVHYLARELRDSRATLLATYRSDEMHRRHPLLRTLGNLQRERLATELPLRRLTPDEIARLIQETFATANPVSAEFRDAIYSRSEGNPFFTEELLKALVEAGDIYRAESGWERKPLEQLRIPDSIRETVHGRIARLSTDAQATLSSAAVIGLRFPFEVLRASGGAAPAEVLGHLRQFIELQLVTEIGGENDIYAFRHALTREVVYEELLAPERKALHRRVAAVLATDDRTEPSLLAYHLLAAGEQANAVPHILEAARRAIAADAPREAAAHYERALEIGVPDDLVGAAAEGLASACLHFDIQRCQRAAEKALELYRRADDRRGVSRVLLIQSQLAEWLADPRGDDLDEEAVAVVEDLGDTAELVQALARLGERNTFRLPERTREIAARLSDLAERMGDPLVSVGADYLAARAIVDERPEEALSLLRPALRRAIDARLPTRALNGYWTIALALTIGGRPTAEILEQIEEGIAYAKEHGVEENTLIPLGAYLRLNRGEWDEAEAAARRVELESSSSWQDNAIEIRARIVEGRQGPTAAAPLYEQHARAWRAIAGADRAPGLSSSAYAAMLVGDASGATEAFEALRRLQLTAGSPQGVFIRARMLATALFLGRIDMVDFVASTIPENDQRMSRAVRQKCEAVRAFLSEDVAESGRRMQEYEKVGFVPRGFVIEIRSVDLVVAFITAARARGWTLGPEWGVSLSEARAFAEKAKATWWLEQLDTARHA